MAITVMDFQNIKEILIEGNDINDIKKIRDWLFRNSKSNIKITFLDQSIIDKEYINIISSYKTLFPNINIKTFCTNKYLSRYLNKFKISNEYIFKKIPEDNIEVLVLGGSAGSLNKIKSIISNIKNENISIFIIQHLSSKSENLLPNILKDFTDFNIPEIYDDMEINVGNIYIAPSGFHMFVQDNKIKLNKDHKVNFARPSIEILFTSLAKEFKNKLMAVLLCGYGNDGVKSFEVLKKNYSKFYLLSPDECLEKQLLINVLDVYPQTNTYTIQEIQREINLKINDTITTKEDIESFLKGIYTVYGFDFRDYLQDSIKRRIKIAMINEGYKSLDVFSKDILNNQQLFENTFLEFSINVTSFFRDWDIFKLINEKIIPYLSTFTNINIWCAGCSSGEEAYSLAILLHKHGLLKKTHIYATDFNKNIIQEAKVGIFPIEYLSIAIKNISKIDDSINFFDYINIEKNNFEIKKEYKDKILFNQHSLVKSGIFNEFQVILCRNVLIYFNNKLKADTLNLFKSSLYKNGFLILGKNEQYEKLLEKDFIHNSNNIYKLK